MEKNNKKKYFISFTISLIITILLMAIITYTNNQGLLLKDSVQTQAKIIDIGELEGRSTGRHSYVYSRRITYCYEGSDGKTYTGTDHYGLSFFDNAWYRKEVLDETIDISFHVDHPEKSMIGKPKHLFLIDDVDDIIFVLLLLIIWWPVVHFVLSKIKDKKREKNLKENASNLTNIDSKEENETSSKQLKSKLSKQHRVIAKQEELNLTSREKAIKFYRSNSERFGIISNSKWFDDKEFALAVIDVSTWHEGIPALYYLSKRLKDDEDVVMEAIKRNHNKDAFLYASDRLKNDREFVLKAVKNGLWLRYVENLYLRNDKEIVLAAIQHGHWLGILDVISKALQDDKEIVLNVFSKEYHDDHHKNPFDYLGPTVKYDHEVIKTALVYNPYFYRYLDDSVKKDTSFLYEVLLELVKKDGMEIKLAKEWLSLKEDSIESKVLALNAVKQNGMALQHVGTILADDKEIVLEAIKNCKEAISFASFRLREDEDVVKIVQS